MLVSVTEPFHDPASESGCGATGEEPDAQEPQKRPEMTMTHGHLRRLTNDPRRVFVNDMSADVASKGISQAEADPSVGGGGDYIVELAGAQIPRKPETRSRCPNEQPADWRTPCVTLGPLRSSCRCSRSRWPAHALRQSLEP